MIKIQEVIQFSDLNDNTCIAFSGGVDSSLLTRIVFLKGFDLSMISISFDKDDEFNYVKKAAKLIGGKHFYSDISITDLEKGLRRTLDTIEYDRIALLENAVGYYFIFKLASDLGFDTVLSAHGVDELHCGYDVFRRRFHTTDLNRLITELTDTAKQDKLVIDRISEIFEIDYLCPFLDDAFIEYSRSVPLSQKICDENDILRKHHIREQALQLGVPEEIAHYPKNSFQYSSGLHKAIRRLARKNGYTNRKGKCLGYESGVKAYITSLIIR